MQLWRKILVEGLVIPHAGGLGACSSKVLVTLTRPGKLFCVCPIYIKEQSFNNFDNDTMNLSVNEEKMTGLWARNCATIQQVLILKFAFGPKKFPGPRLYGSSLEFEFLRECIRTNKIRSKFRFLKTEKCPLSVLTGVRIKRVTFRENVWVFRPKRSRLIFWRNRSLFTSMLCSTQMTTIITHFW